MLSFIEDVGLLRIAVFVGLLVAAIVSGAVSFLTLSSYEEKSAELHFQNVAKYANAALAIDFTEKKNVVLSMSKNMALWKPNISEWPNVVVPGFYDVSIAQRDSAGFGDVSFLPLVTHDQQSSFEAFMYEYFDSERGVTEEAGVSPSGKGVYAYNQAWQTYHDTTGATHTFTSPNNVLAPLLQTTFNDYIENSDLALNLHSLPVFGRTIDAIMDCSTRAAYSVAVTQCTDLLDMLSLPIDAPKEKVVNFFSSFYQPIYLNNNSSQLVGIMGGGFEWVALLSKIFGNHKEGIDIVVRNADTVAIFQTSQGVVEFRSYGNLHASKYDSQALSIMSGAHAHERMYESTYSILIYPSDQFYAHFRSYNPVYAALGSSALFLLLIIIFFVYDLYLWQAAAARQAVLDTQRLFVRFISHEIRSPLNGVHLGLEALAAEIRCLFLHVSPYQCPLRCALASWLELSVEMTSNCDSAEDVLNDLLNYDKIEMGTLRLDFAEVEICSVVRTSVSAFVNQAKVKSIHFALFSDCSVQGDVVVMGDAARLAQVMRNLISNAFKFTPVEGSVTVRVESFSDGLSNGYLSNASTGYVHKPFPALAGSVRISVTDSGAGLSEAQLAKICSEGVQFNANELQAGKGSGLGLFISKGIVEQHGGKLTVTSEGIGKGATFMIDLPLLLRED